MMIVARPFMVRFLTVGCAVLTLSFSAQAQQSQFKIGVVNVKEVFDNYKKQKTEYKNLEAEKDTRQKVIDDMETTIEGLQQRHTDEKDSLAPDALRSLEDEIRTNLSVYQSKYKQLQDEIDLREKRLLEDLFADIRAAVAEVGAKGNYHLVFEAGETGRSGVLYFSTTLNMTQQVIDHLNSNFEKS